MSRRNQVLLPWTNDYLSIGASYNYFDEPGGGKDAEDEQASRRRRLYEVSRRAIQKGLTEREREVFLLYASGLRQVEIADRLGLSKSTVCRELNHAKAKLKNLLWIAVGDRIN